MNDVNSMAGSLLKLAAVGESEASVEGHVTRQRLGSLSINNTATRATTPSAMSKSAADNIAFPAKSIVDESVVQHKVRWFGDVAISD